MAFYIIKHWEAYPTLHKRWRRNLLGNYSNINHIIWMANLFDKLKKRTRAESKEDTPPPSSNKPSGTQPLLELAAEPGADSRREAERKAEAAGVKWRAQAEAKGEIPREIGGPKGLEPTRYGDWEKAGRCYDF